MWLKAASMMTLLPFNAACSMAPRAPSPMDALWQDQAFAYAPSLVQVDEKSLFTLDNDLLRSLRDDPVVARGNEAARTARAHFKAAILAEPLYAASYANLAQLYIRAGLLPGAEALLLQAVALNGQSDLALSSLHRLLLAQGRNAEALAYDERLLARREQDPYYWLGLGLDQLRQARYPQAVDALEHAQALTQGFEEVHRLLAIAYWRAGHAHKARDQLAILGVLDRGKASMAVLNKKFKGLADERHPLQQQ